MAMIKAGILATAASLVLVPAVFAQSTDKNPLTQVKALKCRFTVYASGAWAKTTQEPSAAELKAIREYDTKGFWTS